MENARLHFVAFLTTFSLLNGYCLSAGVFCNSPQNGTIGAVGILQCSFESVFHTISWSYVGEDTHPLVRYDGGVLQGSGHNTDSYSLRIDGALLIIDAASRTGSKEYKVETIDDDGEYSSQTVEYQFKGESTIMHHTNAKSQTTHLVTDTPSFECPPRLNWYVLLGAFVGATVGAFVTGMIAYIKHRKHWCRYNVITLPSEFPRGGWKVGGRRKRADREIPVREIPPEQSIQRAKNMGASTKTKPDNEENNEETTPLNDNPSSKRKPATEGNIEC
ncbi:hypothetical protein HOLleu_03997 [Holothuria leucospilota]|uniref:Immunoglobulin V-set domain-containing protein n=1 Tax=Holothuria leucospilota TaxID=206669 RepID=A0A9Q1CTA9_HOLLE|nr:hypothetical protein HOLleu_03997 [Holothuria leucospilota]